MKATETALVTARRKTGRPLSFDRKEAVQRAMLLFWRRGYEGTSVADLTSTLGITPPSLYAAFGDKKGLFQEAVRCYLGAPLTAEMMIKDAANSYDAAEKLLRGSLIGFTGAQTPAGCLLATSAISCSSDAEDIQAQLAGIRRGLEKRLRGKIIDDIAAGSMPKNTNADALAGHVMCVIQGMSTLARDGAKREKLARIAAVALQVWPRTNQGGARSG